MSIVRSYLPLVGFVVPTVIVGYGVVIPRSCIAGVNELSVGFGTTVLGAVFTYVAGQRAVKPRAAQAKQAWLVRVMRSIDRRALGGRMASLLCAITQRLQARGSCDVRKRLETSRAVREAELGLGESPALRDQVRRGADATPSSKSQGPERRGSSPVSESSRPFDANGDDCAASANKRREPIPELVDLETALRRIGFAIVKAQRCRTVTRFRVLVARRNSDGVEV